jgi:type IV pilus assembly protein PilW
MIRERGLSLTELLIALVVGLFLMTATFSVLEMSSSSVQSTGQLNQLQETARLALRMMEEDIAQTGFFSDLTGVDLITGANAVAPATITGADCVGGGLNNGSFPNGIGNFRTLWAARKVSGSLISCELSTQGDSDVLQLKRLEGTEVTGALSADRYYAVVNINEIHFFGGDELPPVLPGGRIYEYQHRVYYVADNGLGEPALFRHSLTRGSLMEEAEMLAEGVEALQFEFGLDSNGDGSVDAYLTSTDVTDAMWDQRERAEILAVRLHLLLRAQTQDNSYSAGGTRTYQMPGGDMSFADDGYRRKRVSTTIMVQNPWLTTRRTDK